MSATKHVLFVCTGNTCRSPMAEGLFRKAVSTRGDFKVSSAGVAASRGAPCNPETEVILKKRGITMENFRSRQVSETILAEATHVFAMTRGHLDALEDEFPEHSDKFYLTCEFADLPNKSGGMDVPDPIGMKIY
jgi:protein-tyrosine-phosphatase